MPIPNADKMVDEDEDEEKTPIDMEVTPIKDKKLVSKKE
jgi:hypothetical protein